MVKTDAADPASTRSRRYRGRKTANLPTWRIEHHWLLDIFWGSRPMTGYHAWVFPFMALFFHLPPLFNWQ
ncbi:hypothetical protein [Paraburkholderia heleia]|uniref:hypothetical protein n=1 Tax=Paraburkholderia heleia TaxID=634127 RepID=UPI000ACFB80F